MGRSLAVQLSIRKFQILFIYFHRNFYTSNTWDCTKWQFILTTHCLGKHLSNEECWNQNRLLYLSLYQLQTSWLPVQMLVTSSVLLKRKSSTQIIVNSVAWRVDWHYMCLTITILLSCPKIHRATVEVSSLVAITLGLRADQPHCEMIAAKVFGNSCTLDTGKFGRTELVLAGAVS